MKAVALADRRASFRGIGRPKVEDQKGAREPWGWRFSIAILILWGSSIIIGFEAALAGIVLLGYGAAILGIRRPTIALLGIAILVVLDAPARHFLSGTGLLRWNTLNYLLLIVLLLSVPMLLRLRDPHTRLLQAFVLVLGLEIIISPSIRTGLNELLPIVAMFGLLIYFVRSHPDSQSLYSLALVVGVLAAAGGLVYYFTQDQLPPINQNSWASFPAAALMAIALSTVAGRYGFRKLVILLLLASVSFVWVFLSGSRGNLAIAVCCMLLIVLKMPRLEWAAVSLVIVLLTGVILASVFSDQQANTVQRLEKLFDPSYSLASRTSGRSNIAEVGWLIFLENPLGIGTGGFRSMFPSYDDPYFSASDSGTAAHSAWVKTLAENGIPGALLLVAYVISFAIVGLSRKEPHLRLLGLFVAVVLSLAFATTEFGWKGLWFLAAGATFVLHKKGVPRAIQAASRRVLPRRRFRQRSVGRS